MTTQIAPPVHHFSTKAVLVAVLALALAAIVGFGVAALTLDRTVSTTTVGTSGSGAGPSDYLEKLYEREAKLKEACASGLLPDC